MTFESQISPERLALAIILALATGWALGQWWRARELRRNRGRVRREFKEIIQDAERISKAKLLEAEIAAKQIVLDLKAKFELEIEKVKENLNQREESLSKQVSSLKHAEDQLGLMRQQLNLEKQTLENRVIEINQKHQEIDKNLKQLCNQDPKKAVEFAKQEILFNAQKQASLELKKISEQSQDQLKQASQKIITSCIERISRDFVAEKTTLLIPLPSTEMKGRVIGRDGRNVRAFEAIAGVDVLLEDVPDHVVISCHNPERREIARQAMIRLIQDGRIQPSRIEEFVKQAKLELNTHSDQLGVSVINEFGLNNVAPEVSATLGKLNYRTSYSQNVLLHLKESAYIAGMLAAELGLDQNIAQRAALLHDIGKAMSEQFAGPHALVGAEFLSKHGESDLVVNAVAAHHNEVPEESIYACLVKAADALSGARPGARREEISAYIKRLEKMEAIATSFAGVENVYAFQAGRELRVVVNSSQISESQVSLLVQQLAHKIETELKFSGDVKISVLRETKAIGVARGSLGH